MSGKAPWDDCMIAIGVDDDEPFEGATYATLRGHSLPRDWAFDHLDGTGARWVALFRVSGIPTAYAGRRVRSVLRTIGALRQRRSWEGQECAECGDILVANEEGQPTCTCCGRPGPRKESA